MQFGSSLLYDLTLVDLTIAFPFRPLYINVKGYKRGRLPRESAVQEYEYIVQI